MQHTTMLMPQYTVREMKLRAELPGDLRLLELYKHAELATDYASRNPTPYEAVQTRVRAAIDELPTDATTNDDPLALTPPHSLVTTLTVWWERDIPLLKNIIRNAEALIQLKQAYLGRLHFSGHGLTPEYVKKHSSAMYLAQTILLLDEMVAAKEKGMTAPDYSFFANLMPKLTALSDQDE